MTETKPKINFASDNYSPVHPKVLEMLAKVNQHPEPAYGADSVTAEATAKIKEIFGSKAHPFFVWNGTAANVLSLSAVLQPYQSVLCSDFAHIALDECGAVEKWSGSKIVPVKSVGGKIHPDLLPPFFARKGDQHASQIRVISISQTNEYGTVYSLDEIRALSQFAKSQNCFLHMDGARLSNAAVSLDKPFAEFTVDAGVDLLSFGGTKNGLMGAECIVFFRPELAEEFAFIRKQGLHLPSKMRYLSAQLLAFFEDELWKKNASQANAMAKRLADGLRNNTKGIKINQPVDANVVFASIPEPLRTKLQTEFHFYVWSAEASEVRLMCSFDTKASDVDAFIARIE